MRHLFASKDHKKRKSFKLQKKLQSEEDRLWHEEHARRQAQELLDEEMARRIQEELEQEQELQQQQASPLESDEAPGRPLHQEFELMNTSRRHSRPQSPLEVSNNNQVPSDEEYARQLQEEFDAEREGRHVLPPASSHQASAVSSIPPSLPLKPTVYNDTHQLAESFSGPEGSTSMSSASSSSSVTNTSGHPVPPPPYVPSTSPSLNSHSDTAEANSTTMASISRDRFRASICAESPPPVINTLPLYTTNHSPLTTSTPRSTTSTITPPAAFVLVTPTPFSQSYPQIHAQCPGHETNTATPLPISVPAAPRLSHAQFPSLQQQSPYPPQGNGPSLSQQREEKQQYRMLYRTTNHPTANREQPQEDQQHGTQTIGARLSYGHTNESHVGPILFVVPLPQCNENELTSLQHYPEQNAISDFMPLPVPPTVACTDWATPPPSHTKTSTPERSTAVPFQPKEILPSDGQATPALFSGILRTSHKPVAGSPHQPDTPIKEKEAIYKEEEPLFSSSESDPFDDSYVVESMESSEDEDDEGIQHDILTKGVPRGIVNPAITIPVVTKSNWVGHPTFNPVNCFEDDDQVDLDPKSKGPSDDDGSAEDHGDVMVTQKCRPKAKIGVTMAIQTDPVEESSSPASGTHDRQQNNRSTVTRIDPTFGITILPPPAQSTDVKPPLALRTPSLSTIQIPLEGLLVDVSTDNIVRNKVEKTQTTQEPPVPATQVPQSRRMMHSVHHPYSLSSLVPSVGTGQFQLKQTYPPAPPRVMPPATYHDTLNTSVPIMYDNKVLCETVVPIANGAPGPYHTNGVLSNEYGYYPVENKSDEYKLGRTDNTTLAVENPFPAISKSDTNHRHITVTSIDPDQRVWIQVNPTDTGKVLARRIHIVATYRTRKILSIKTAYGRVIPLDNTPVFDDWSELEKLEDGVPWQVEWGPLDDPFSGGYQLFNHIKENIRAAVMD